MLYSIGYMEYTFKRQIDTNILLKEHNQLLKNMGGVGNTSNPTKKDMPWSKM